MNDVVSSHFHISITVYFTATLLAVVVGVASFSLIVFNNYTDKYTTAMTDSTNSALYDMASQKKISCPQAYAAINTSLSIVNKVTLKLDGEAEKVIYEYSVGNESERDLMKLMTGTTSTKNVRMYVSPAPKMANMINIELVEVK